MHASVRNCLIAAVLLPTSSTIPARADSITAGSITGWGACVPFGCAGATIYQQVYSSALFPHVLSITGLEFFNTVDHFMGDRSIDPAQYEIWLSTTRVAVNHLDPVVLDSNHGPDAARVFSGWLGGSAAGDVPPGPLATLAFTWTTPFTYDPLSGNLLLEIRKAGGRLAGEEGTYLDFDEDEPGMSLVSNHAPDDYWNNRSAGLVTRFNGIGPGGTASPVPEPGTMVLLGTGIIGAVLRLRRHAARSAPSS
jgi:hypothetical protein